MLATDYAMDTNLRGTPKHTELDAEAIACLDAYVAQQRTRKMKEKAHEKRKKKSR